MKSIIKFFILSIILNSFTWIAPQKVSAQASVSFQNFYDDLSPYGNWIDNSDYGYVWVPNVSPGFIPYSTDGYWLFTDEGWTWVSDYSWGWAPFHYGRWFYDNYQGWLWVPDNEWGPGWVSWRRSEGYYGWAPMSPGFNVAINYNSSNSLPYNEWTFVRNRDFGRRDINKYFVSSSGNSIIYNNSTTINNIRTDRSNNVRYNAGPDRAEVERNAGKSFTPVVIRERNTPGRNQNKNEIQIYRPQVQKNIPDGRRPAPQRVMNWKDLKQTVGQGNSRTIQPQKVNQPDKGLPVQRQRNDQPFKQQPLQQKQNDKPGKQNHSKAQQTNPLKK
ncbi:MAG TPA: DUF6600 domain-containing protein [Chitinophagaceae bacterium]|nr:DUF6600 domain-containing protein [Chitinophagaceae bacterium]